VTPDLTALLADPARALDVPIGEVPALLAALIPDLGDDELELPLVIATPLWDGHRRVGYFDLDRDSRDFGTSGERRSRRWLTRWSTAASRSSAAGTRASLRRNGHREGGRG